MSSACSPRVTPYPDVNALLGALLAGVRGILGPRFVGLYLGGSLSAGGFDPLTSDVDFLVVTDEEVPGGLLPALTEMHARIAASGPRLAEQLEGSYIPIASLRRHNPPDNVHPHVSTGGGLRVETHEAEWVIQRWVFREQGLAAAGPPPKTLIDPISPEELRQAVRDLLHGWWTPMLDAPVLLQQPFYRAYAVLTMCRMLYTLEHGSIVPKPVAARWAQHAADCRGSLLIGRAMDWPRGQQTIELNETLCWIRHTLSASEQWG